MSQAQPRDPQETAAIYLRNRSVPTAAQRRRLMKAIKKKLKREATDG